MKSLWIRFAQDERGFVISAELVLVMTLGVLSMVVGLQAVSSAITQELNDVANAFGAVSQSYGYRSITKRRHAWISGSAFHDRADFCDCNPILQADVVGHIGLQGYGGSDADGSRIFDPQIHRDGHYGPGHEVGPKHGPMHGQEFGPERGGRHGHWSGHGPRPGQIIDPKPCCPEEVPGNSVDKKLIQGTERKHDNAPKLEAPDRDSRPKKND